MNNIPSMEIKCGFFESTRISFKPIEENGLFLSVATESGIEICLSESHSMKAFSPIDVTDDGIVIFLSKRQYAKAFSPIDDTDDGIRISVRERQPRKAQSPIDGADDGISIWVSD